MSELINSHDNRATIRWKLLTGASVLALTAYVSTANVARADDTDHPQLWIELGGQLSLLNSSQEKLDPPFFAAVAAVPDLDSPLKFEKEPRYSIDETGKLSFQPKGSDWVFSASVRYGRSASRRHVEQQQSPGIFIETNVPNSLPPPYYITQTYIPALKKFSSTQWASSEKHTILDFQAGKDVGLGLFGKGYSTVEFGARVVQFAASSKVDVNADPTLSFPSQHQLSWFTFVKYQQHGDLYWEHALNERSFRGVGPTISWQGSAPIAGNSDSTELAIDWGLNAAVLFGRQKARGYHQSSSRHFTKGLGSAAPQAVPTHVGPYVPHDRSRSVTVPNIGGSLGISFKSGDAKVSFGYRADLFVGAMDTGIDVAKKSNMLFHGPYASISIGLGD